MTSENSAPDVHASLADDLPLLVKDYGLGQVRDARYLAEGLMNRNWRVSTARGEFALKQIVDVTLPLARRNLAVVAALAAAGVPTAVAAPSTTGDLVIALGSALHSQC